MYAQLTDSLRRIDFRSPVAVGLIVFAILIPAIAVVKAHTAPDYGVSKARATKLARDYGPVRKILRQDPPTRIRVSPLDDEQQRVSFFNGSRWIVDAAVAPRGVTRIAYLPHGAPLAGSEIANATPMLLGLTLLFILATATVPLLSWRNLDVLVLASFTAVVMFMNAALVIESIYVGYPALAYLALRCMAIGLGPPRDTAGTSLLWHLARGWPAAQRLRTLRYVLIAMVLTTAMVVPSSTGAVDVAFAGASGATALLHGMPPYGHIPNFIFHGDTYPFFNYVLYIPGAALIPVTDAFSDPTGALIVAGVATLLAAAGLYRIGRRLAEEADTGAAGAEEPRFAGMRIALAWLAFPPVLLSASSGTNDPILAAWLVAAFAFFSRGVLSTFLLGVAAWVKMLPLLAIPIWLARLSLRGALRAVVALAAFSAALVGWLLAVGGTGAVTAMLEGVRFQFDRGSLHSVWQGLDASGLQPVATALLLAAAVASTVAVRRDPSLREDIRRIGALFAGLMLISMIAANYWTWAYLPWTLVPMLVSLLAPARIPAAEQVTARPTRDWASGTAAEPLPSGGS